MFHSAQASRFAIVLGVILLLIIAVSGMEASADDKQAISSSSPSNSEMLQVARAPASSIEHLEAIDLFGPDQDYAASRQGENRPTTRILGLGTPFGQTGVSYLTADGNDRNGAPVARVASCHDASVGRYHGELRGAFANNFAASDKLDSAVTHFYAQRASKQQFGSCSSF